MICFCLTHHSLFHCTTLIEKYQLEVDLFELRVDLLDQEFQKWEILELWIKETKEMYNKDIIFTVRLPQDGGEWQGTSTQREALLSKAMASNLCKWVDIEADGISNHEFSPILHHHVAENTTPIISRHYFIHENIPLISNPDYPWVEDMLTLAEHFENTLIKVAISCNSTAMLCDILEQCNILQEKIPNRYIIAPMGMFGIPGRVLTTYTGSQWTYSSEGLLHLGQLTPTALHEYRYRQITKATKLYAIIGNPVMHSKSPEYHNKKFRDMGFQVDDFTSITNENKTVNNKVYIHLPIDDCACVRRLNSLLNLRGLSVTIPHKQKIIKELDYSDEYVQQCKSCNTVIINTQGQWKGYNTDIPGFLAPLKAYLESISHHSLQDNFLEHYKITVLGAGGTARALAFGLLKAGGALLIANRTVKKAEILATQLQKYNTNPSQNIAVTDLNNYSCIAQYSDIIIQTTSIGMNDDHSSPIPLFPFTGKEIVYDVIYTPPITRILREAQEKGCHTLSGEVMFNIQAELQSQLFCVE